MNSDANPIFTLAWTFGLMSLFAVGGANSAIPEMHRVAVDVQHWMTDKQFADAFAISQMSPGPNVLIVTLIGYAVAGIGGALIATLAIFVLVSNLIGLVPGFFPPTANINTTAACAVIVFISTHIVGLKHHGAGYIKHFCGPIAWLAPVMFFIEVIGHLSRPVSLTLRLFGNMNGHELVLMIFFGLAPFLVPLPMMLMGVLVSFIQAFVFMLLAMIYIQGSLEHAH